jgi:arsenate reductase
MSDIKIWHNPRCSKSREAVKIAEDAEVQTTLFKYLDENPDIETLKNVLEMLEFESARDWMRTKEEIYKELNLQDETDEEKLLEAMAANPKLIERPVIIKGNKAIIGRPTSIIKDFLNN